MIFQSKITSSMSKVHLHYFNQWNNTKNKIFNFYLHIFELL